MNSPRKDEIHRLPDAREMSIDELEIVAGGRSGTGRVTVQPFHMTHTYDRASPMLP